MLASDPPPADPIDSPESAPWAVLIGVHDPVLLARWCAVVPRLLVLQPNPLLADRLIEAWNGCTPAGLEILAELPAAQSGPIPWYVYNDGRLDGTRGPASLHRAFPNLRLRAEQTRAGQPLKQLLLDWWQRCGDPDGDGTLLVQGEDFEAVVRGAAEWIDRFERLIHLPGSHERLLANLAGQGEGEGDRPAAATAGAGGAEALAEWLEACCFSPTRRDDAATHDGALCWRRDQHRLLRRRFAQLQAEHARLRQQHDAWCQERLQLQLAFELVHRRLRDLAPLESAEALSGRGGSVEALLGPWADWQT